MMLSRNWASPRFSVGRAQGAEFAIVCCAAAVSEAMEAYEAMREEVRGNGWGGIHWSCRSWAACAANGSGPWEKCGDISRPYREYRIDAQAITEAAAHACLDTAGWQAGR